MILNPTVPVLMLLAAVSLFALEGCGGEATPSSGPGMSLAETGDGGTTTTQTGGEETTSAGTASRTLYLAPSRGSGVSGTAFLTDTPGGTEIALNVRNLTDGPNTRHLAHVHEGGTCADEQAGDNVPVRYSLYPVITQVDGTAFSASVIPDVTLNRLFSGPPKYIDVHAAATGDETPPTVACADLPSGADDTASAYTGAKAEA